MIDIPIANTTNMDASDLMAVLQIYYTIQDSDDHEFIFKGDRCRFYNAGMTSLFAAVSLKLLESGKNVRFDLDSLPDNVKNILQRNRFLTEVFGIPPIPDSNKTTIPFKRLGPQDELDKTYLDCEAFPKITSSELKNELKKSLFEVVDNGRSHSRAPELFICGQHFPNQKRFDLMITDMGVGIRGTVARVYGNAGIDCREAIEWALQKGNTSKSQGPRGVGLFTIVSFIKKNGGKFIIMSGDSIVIHDENGGHHFPLDRPFPGTCVGLSVKTDGKMCSSLEQEICASNIF